MVRKTDNGARPSGASVIALASSDSDMHLEKFLAEFMMATSLLDFSSDFV